MSEKKNYDEKEHSNNVIAGSAAGGAVGLLAGPVGAFIGGIVGGGIAYFMGKKNKTK